MKLNLNLVIFLLISAVMFLKIFKKNYQKIIFKKGIHNLHMFVFSYWKHRFGFNKMASEFIDQNYDFTPIQKVKYGCKLEQEYLFIELFG